MPPCDKSVIVTVLFGTSAFACGILGTTWCEYVSFTSEQNNSFTFGIWYYTYWEQVNSDAFGQYIRESCHLYPDYQSYDSAWRTAKAFSIIAPVFGGVTLFWLYMSMCCYPSPALWKKFGAVFVLNTLFQGLTLMYLSSDKACTTANETLRGQFPLQTFTSNCDMDWGAKLSISSTVLYFVTGIIMCAIPPPTRPEPGPVETQTVTYTKTTQEDGTQVVDTKVVKGEYVPGEPANPVVEQAENP